jgi:hypothetical protein
MSSAGLYTKQLYIPQTASQYTVQVQRRCANPIGPQKPFPFAVNAGSNGAVGTTVGAASSSNPGPPPPITTPIYLTPPEWYTEGQAGMNALIAAESKSRTSYGLVFK